MTPPGKPHARPIRAALVMLAAAAALSAASCAHAPREARPGTSYNGVASWYGGEFHGRRTASGEVFDMHKMTAAHRTFPFGTRLSVTNPADGRKVTVTVNDRGPFVRGRELDLSMAAARSIGISLGEVEIEVLGRDETYVKDVRTGDVSGKGRYRVQTGSFIDPWNAEHLSQGLMLAYPDVRITKAKVRGETYNRVQVGSYGSRDEAESAAARLADEGYETLIIRSE